MRNDWTAFTYEPLDILAARYSCGDSPLKLREEREKLIDRIEYLQNRLKELTKE